MKTQVYGLAANVDILFSLTCVHVNSLFSCTFSHSNNYGNYTEVMNDGQHVSLAQILPDGIRKLPITMKLVEVNFSTLSDSNLSVKDWLMFSV